MWSGRASIFSIARRYGVSSASIIDANRLSDPSQLAVGQAIVIPEISAPTVSAGESLFTIARNYGVSLNSLIAANPGINPARLQIGQTITIPVPSQPLGTIYVNGYAFPNISMDVLRSTLPYLTYLSVFSYQVRPDGSLPEINDTPLIQTARAAGVAPLMVITNIEEGASFSSDLARAIFDNQEAQENLINNVVEVLQQKNYYGLDVDFEYIYSEDREKYNNFMRALNARLRPWDFLSLHWHRNSADQRGFSMSP